MKDTNLIPDSCNSLVDSFYSSCESSTLLFYTALDNRQALLWRGFQLQKTPLDACLKRKLIDRSAIAFTKNSGIYDRNRALHHKILRQRDRYRSAQCATSATRQNENATIERTKAENPRCNAQKKGSLRRHETPTDRSLQAFLPALSVREWARSGIRYSLKKAAQVGTRSLQLRRKPLQTGARSTQLIDDQGRSFWQWFRQPSDLPNSGVYERDRSLHRSVLRQRDQHKSAQIVTIDTRQKNRHKSYQIIAIDTRQNEALLIGQDEPEYAPSSRKYAVRAKHETLTGRSLRAFLPAFAVRAWNAIAHRYSLEKPLQTGAQTLQATGYRGRSFWRWIEPFPDVPICIPEGARFLKKGGAA